MSIGAIGRRMALAALAGALAACSGLTRDAAAVTPSEVVPQVIVGADEKHVMITEPLEELIPKEHPDDANVTVTFEAGNQPIMLGIEGAVAFVRAEAADGTPVVDRAVSLSGETIPIPAGEHLLVAYYRACDGNCELLDPPADFCSVEAVLDADEDYALRILLIYRPTKCVLEPMPSNS